MYQRLIQAVLIIVVIVASMMGWDQVANGGCMADRMLNGENTIEECTKEEVVE